jgi:hypothetical protein
MAVAVVSARVNLAQRVHNIYSASMAGQISAKTHKNTQNNKSTSQRALFSPACSGTRRRAEQRASMLPCPGARPAMCAWADTPASRGDPRVFGRPACSRDDLAEASDIALRRLMLHPLDALPRLGSCRLHTRWLLPNYLLPTAHRTPHTPLRCAVRVS